MKWLKFSNIAPILSVLMCLSLVGGLTYMTISADSNKIPPEYVRIIVEHASGLGSGYLGYDAYRTNKYLDDDGAYVYEIERDTEVKFYKGLCRWGIEQYLGEDNKFQGKLFPDPVMLKRYWIAKEYYYEAETEDECYQDDIPWIGMTGLGSFKEFIPLWDKWAMMVVSGDASDGVCSAYCDILENALKKGTGRPSNIYAEIAPATVVNVRKGVVHRSDWVFTFKAEIDTLPGRLIVLKSGKFNYNDDYELELTSETPVTFLGLEDGDVDSIEVKSGW